MNDLTVVRPNIGLMIDTESLGLSPKSVMTQFAFVAWPLDDPDSILREEELYLPAQPQLDLGRVIEFNSLLWLLDQPDSVRARMAESRGNDFEELLALLRSIVRKFNSVTDDGRLAYEVWVRRPQHDIPMINSLFRDCGIEVPWDYTSVNDLASLMNQAGVTKADVDMSGFSLHTAIGDCKFQIRCYAEAIKQLRASS